MLEQHRIQLDVDVITDQAVQMHAGKVEVTEQITEGPEVSLAFGLQTGTIYTNLSPEEAREVADTLTKAAAKMEDKKQVAPVPNNE